MMTAPMAVRKAVTLSPQSFVLLVLLALGLAVFYRIPALERRPMHTDEAVLAVKLSDFWQTGHFDYDPHDYHGPALHQVSWLWGHAAGWAAPANWTEGQLRVVPALCGLALILMTLVFWDALGRNGVAWAMLLMAVSPMMVFYSRYFIMEMLLAVQVTVMLAAFWRYAQIGGRGWLILGGIALGLQHATKETFILNAGAALCGWIGARVVVGGFTPRPSSGLRLGPASRVIRPSRPWLWVGVPAVAVSVACYSSGFRDWQAVLDSVTTYGHYLERSGGSGHEKPLTYYLTLIFGQRDKVIWSEALIGGLAIGGMLQAFFGEFRNQKPRQAFQVFLSIYTLALFTVYSLLSYKTPWSILSAQHTLTLLAGLGAGAVWTWLGAGMPRWIYTILLLGGVYNLCAQSSRVTGSHPHPSLELSADPANPYAYAHTLPKALKLVAAVRQLEQKLGADFSAQVISADQGWPLPWYLRNLPRIGYQAELPDPLTAPVVIVESDKAEAAEKLMAGANYDRGTQFGLRPGVILVLYVKGPKPPPPAPPPEPMPAPQPGGADELMGPPWPTPSPSSPDSAPAAEAVPDDAPASPVPEATMQEGALETNPPPASTPKNGAPLPKTPRKAGSPPPPARP